MLRYIKRLKKTSKIRRFLSKKFALKYSFTDPVGNVNQSQSAKSTFHIPKRPTNRLKEATQKTGRNPAEHEGKRKEEVNT